MIKQIITIVVVIAVILWLLSAVGVFGGLHSVRVGLASVAAITGLV